MLSRLEMGQAMNASPPPTIKPTPPNFDGLSLEPTFLLPLEENWFYILKNSIKGPTILDLWLGSLTVRLTTKRVWDRNQIFVNI